MSFRFPAGDSVVKGDFSKLEKLVRDLRSKHSVDIGVFSTAVTSSGMSVAEYGAYNEFGSISRPNHPPKRSFIRMPLTKHSGKIVNYVEKRAPDHLEKGDVKAIFEDIGVAGESVIQEAFDTRGFGTWKPDAPSTVKKKGSDAPLIDDGTLRHAITHRTK